MLPLQRLARYLVASLPSTVTAKALAFEVTKEGAGIPLSSAFAFQAVPSLSGYKRTIVNIRPTLVSSASETLNAMPGGYSGSPIWAANPS